MPSQRLYQQDSYLSSFESRVCEVQAVADASEQYWLRLEASAFYPTAGGQPHDTGWLEHQGLRLQVLEVANRSGDVWHRVQGALPELGQVWQGSVDWPRRYRHMQRHSGQHLLSQAFLRLSPAYETRSVSLSSAQCSLDLAGDPDDDALQAAETEANAAAYRGLAIRSFEVDEADISRYPLRRPPKVSGRIRLVQMGDWEVSACGGTHLRSSNEAAPIKVLRSERIKGSLVRVYFVCGWEAQGDYRAKHALSSYLIEQFSAQLEDIPERLEALQAQLRTAQTQLEAAQLARAQLLAAQLSHEASDAANPATSANIVSHQLAEEDSVLRQPLAQALQGRGCIALLGCCSDGKAQLLFAAPEGRGDMAALLRQVLPHIQGRGGGKATLAQGGGSHCEGLATALQQAQQRCLLL